MIAGDMVVMSTIRYTMKESDKIEKQIEQIAVPIIQAADAVGKAIPEVIEQLNEVLPSIVDNIGRVVGAIGLALSTIHKPLLKKIVEVAEKWQIERKADVTLMAENGWYPNWFTFFYTPSRKAESIDEIMSMHLNENWDDITSQILKLCPKRNHILGNAFNLHKSGNYIAAIPLFLSQADGICCESILKSFLFTENKVEENTNNLIDAGKIEANMLTDVFLEPFKLKNHHKAGVSKYSQTAKARAPSRNGILHGHRKHLDYGTEINSLKYFSLLSFIVFSTKELIETT